jgi:hypothetical protein
MLQLPSALRTARRRSPPVHFAVLLLVGTGLLAASSSARAADPYRIAGVHVAAKGKTPSVAKNRAVARGLPVALRRLVRRVTTAEDFKRLSPRRWRGTRALVVGYEVEREHAAGDRYDGVLAYRFDRNKVRAWLRDQGVAVIDTMARPVLVLPVWQAPRGPLLWDEPNPWRHAWSLLDRPDGLVPIVTGSGELADLQTIDGAQAVAGDAAALAAIARRYRAGAVVVAVATPAGKRVEIVIRRYPMPGGPPRPLGTVRAGRGEAALKAAAERIVASLEAAWKRSNRVDDTATTTLRVIAPLDGLSYWTMLQARLGGVPLVRHFRVVQFATNRSILDIVHAGTVDQLRGAMTEAGLTLRRDEAADRWVLRLEQAPPAARQPPPVPPASRQPPPAPRDRKDDRRP